MHKILTKFNFDNLLLKEYNNWYLLLRKEQVTLGSLVLIEKSFKTMYSEISDESFIEFGQIVKEIEFVLKETFSYDKINYLMLMMVDDEVHYHVIPRYSKNVLFESVIFKDNGWPELPNFNECNEIDNYVFNRIVKLLTNKLSV